MKKRDLKKILIFLLIISILVPNCFFKNTEKVLAAQTGTVTAETLNVRAKPSATADKVILNGTNVYLTKGETVNILGKDGDFYYVSLKFNGKTVKGYVHKDYVKAAAGVPTATPKPTATPVPSKENSIAVTKEVQLTASVSATTLNVRSGPGTSYSKVAGLTKGDTVTVLCDAAAEDTEWYGISFRQNGQTLKGYVSGAYLTVSYSGTIKAAVSDTSVKIRSAAGSGASYLKQKNGTVITLKKGTSVTVTGEKTEKEEKWYQLSFTISGTKYTGYAEAIRINLKSGTAKPTATPKPASKPTATPKPTTKPKATATPKPTTKPKATATPKLTTKPKATATPKPTVKPAPTPTPAAGSDFKPTVSDSGVFYISNDSIRSSITGSVTGYVCNVYYLNVFENVQKSFALLYDDNSQPVILKSADKVTITDALSVSGTQFYKIEFTTSATKKTGYVQSIYIYIPTKNSGSPTGATPTPSPAPTSKPSATPTPEVNNNADFEANLKEFPTSYRDALIKLHEVYPNWVFKAYDTGKDWSEVIEAESKVGKNLVPNTKSMEWLSMETGAYSWETDTFQPFDGKTWVTASEEAVKYYMDPRNFLTTSGIFQFELLKYQSGYQNISGVNNMLKGTALYASEYSYQDENGNTASYSYAETFMKAAKYSGVSPYHLASRVKQEVVTGITTLSSSVSGTYPGYEGYYNFYNIGASDSAGGGAVAKGLKFAMSGVSSAEKNAQYLIPWSNPYRSIVGGAYYLGSNYISRGQDTIYLQKFNVTPTTTYYHQYMSNLEAPYAEGKKVLAAYSGLLDSSIIFSIPVYDNMPKTVCSIPAVEYNPNNRMKDLKVFTLSGRELTKTPSFSQTVKSYDLIVDNSVDSVRIAASAVSKKATVSGTGTVSLKVGTNKFVVSVKAQNGDVSKYTVTIVRSEQVATPTPTPTPAATKAPTQSPTKAPTQAAS